MRRTADKPWSAAAAKNAAPILEVLQRELQGCSDVLEIGSGTGQHAVRFAQELDFLNWQPSDLDENLAGISAWVAEANLANVRAPMSLDVTCDEVGTTYDAVYSANTAHIMSFPAVTRMFGTVGDVLRRGGVFCLYGPFRRSGEFNTESNARFDASLRSRDAAMGLRNLEDLDDAAEQHGMMRAGLYAVPSNNLVVVWRKK